MFICHSSADAPLARQVAEHLEAAGTPCWIAPRNIPAGADYTSAILDGLAAAPAVVLVFSGATNASPHVRRELETAVGRDTPLLPVRVELVAPSPSLRYFIGTAQWLDTAGIPAATWAAELVEAVRRLVRAAPEPLRHPAAPVGAATPAADGRPGLPPLTGTTWGRQALVEDVVRLLGSGPGLVTLTGPGGVGKTRVAAEVAARLPGLEVADGPDRQRLPDASAGPVLATSRRPLGLPGERVVPVPPLDEESALAMFHEAVTGALPSFDVAANTARSAEVCALLGRLPLGLQLAASRLRVVGLERLHSGLATSLDLVADLGTVLEQSLAALDDADRATLERLSVLWTPIPLEAVEALAPGPHAIDSLGALLEAGLVLGDPGSDRPHYVLPHPVRLVARRSLENGEHAHAAYEAAGAHLLARTRDWLTRLDGADGPEVAAEFATASPDVEGAVEAALTAGRLETAADLALAAAGLWLASGRAAQGEQQVTAVLAAVPDDHPAAARLQAAQGRLAYHLTQWPAAESALRRAVALGQETGDAATAATAGCYLAGTLLMTGRLDEGRVLAERAYAETEALGLYPQAAEGLSMLAVTHVIAGDLAAEREAHERRLVLVRRHGDVARTADTLNTLAEIAIDEEDGQKARRYAEESLVLAADRLPVERREATITLARAHAVLGDRETAGRLLGDAVAASGETGQSMAVAQCLRLAAVLAGGGGDPALAVRLFSAAEALSPSVGGADEPLGVDNTAALAAARVALEERAAEREWALGGALPLATMLGQLDDAVALTRAERP